MAAADSTPGRAAASATARSKAWTERGRSGSPAWGSATRAVRTRAGSKPSDTPSSCAALRISRPAPTSRTRARATSTTSRAVRTRSRGEPVPRLRPPSLRTVWRSGRARRSAGTRPKSRVATRPSPRARASTGPSSRTWSSRGMEAGLAPRIARMAAAAKASPAAHPARPSTRLSVRSWRTIRPRPAPSAARTAISRDRAAPRASSRFATLTQAISSTQSDRPLEHDQPLAEAAHAGRRGSLRAAPRCRCCPRGWRRRAAGAAASTSLCARAMETPGRSRPTRRR